jgi:hypothetical protein
MSDLVDRDSKGLRRFYVCYFCNFTIYKRFFLWPRRLGGNTCPMCEAEGWYKGPILENTDECNCCVHTCNNCRGTLCVCTIDSISGLRPWCGLFDRWLLYHRGYSN